MALASAARDTAAVLCAEREVLRAVDEGATEAWVEDTPAVRAHFRGLGYAVRPRRDHWAGDAAWTVRTPRDPVDRALCVSWAEGSERGPSVVLVVLGAIVLAFALGGAF